MGNARKRAITKGMSDARLKGEINKLRKHVAALEAGNKGLKKQVDEGSRRIGELRVALGGDPIRRHVIASPSAREVASAMNELGIETVRACENGALLESD